MTSFSCQPKPLAVPNAAIMLAGVLAFTSSARAQTAAAPSGNAAPTADNAGKLANVLSAFGFPELAPSAEEWTQGKAMIQLGRDPYRVDLLNFASGLNFSDAWKASVTGTLGGTEVHCLDRDALVKNKLASGRLKDFADAEAIAPERSSEIRAALAKTLFEKPERPQ